MRLLDVLNGLMEERCETSDHSKDVVRYSSASDNDCDDDIVNWGGWFRERLHALRELVVWRWSSRHHSVSFYG